MDLEDNAVFLPPKFVEDTEILSGMNRIAPILGDIPPTHLLNAFFASFAMILVSEIGDKTFFIAALMSMRHSAFTVFSGALAALALMTLLSALVGAALPRLIPSEVTHYLCILLFVYFGFRMLYEAFTFTEGDGPGELAEVEASILTEGGKKSGTHDGVELTASRDTSNERPSSAVVLVGKPGSAKITPPVRRMSGERNILLHQDPTGTSAENAPNAVEKRWRTLFWRFTRLFKPSSRFISPVLIQVTQKIIRVFATTIFLQVFSLTFLAEWGDRSQIATIALAAARGIWAVTAGGILGHAICTGAACAGGKMLASRISERAVAIAGGILFLCFAVAGLITGNPSAATDTPLHATGDPVATSVIVDAVLSKNFVPGTE